MRALPEAGLRASPLESQRLSRSARNAGRHRRRGADARMRTRARRDSGELDVDAPVVRALLLDLAEPDGPDLAGVPDVRPATGLQIDAGDLEEADASCPGRRPYRERAD